MMKLHHYFKYILLTLIIAMPTIVFARDFIQLQVQGVTHEIQQNIQDNIVVAKKKLSAEPNEKSVQQFYLQSKKIVKASIEPYGYFNPIIHSQLLRTQDAWQISYQIILGQPVRIRNVTINVTGEGRSNNKILKFINKIPLKTNDIFTANAYNNAKNSFYDVTYNEGYIKAVLVTSRVIINTKAHYADIIWQMDTGKRYYFGNLTFNETPFAESFLSRFDIFHHQPFSSERLIQYQQDMNDSPYFDSAVVTPDIDNTNNNLVPINVSVIPPKARVYNFGLGYGTFTGARFTSNIKFSRLTNTGDSLDLKLKVSSVLTGLASQYTIPGANPLTESIKANASYQRFRPKNGSSDSANLSLYYAIKHDHWNFQAGVNYLIEKYNINSSVENTPNQTSGILYPALTISYLKANDVLRPTSGKSFSLTLQGSSEYLLSSTSFSQAELAGKYLWSPLSFSQFIFRGSLGYTVVHDLSDLPLTLRFFAGGPSSIRGFPDSSIGPGRYLGILSIEYRHRIYKDVWGAVFADEGTATNHFGSPLNRGVGVGAIYQSIIGPIKLYVAQAVSKPNKPYQVEFVMGPEF